MRSALRFFKRVFIGYYRWRVSGRRLAAFNKKHSRKVYFDLRENKFERYLYLFIKFFLLEGYQVYIRRRFRFLGDLETYSKWLLKEDGVYFCTGPPQNCLVKFSDQPEGDELLLSYDYFSAHANTPGSYHVPMSMHPFMYKDLYWDVDFTYEPHVQSVFFAGSFRRDAYHHLTAFQAFNVLNRIEVLQELVSLDETELPRSVDELNGQMAAGKVIIVDRAQFSISQGQWRRYLSKFDFFLACPGVSMPLAHNLVEAMSCSCIPVIEKEYAALFTPSLVADREAVIFDQEEFTLPQAIQKALAMQQEQREAMRSNVFEYYRKYLTPHGVVSQIMESRPPVVYLNAEAHSVRAAKRSGH